MKVRSQAAKSAPPIVMPGKGFGAGHTAQYMTLLESICLAVEALETDLKQLDENGYGISAASLVIEARVVTIALLSAACCESVANTILGQILSSAEFDKVDWEPTTKKWAEIIPNHLKYTLPPAILCEELYHLFDLRNAIVHAKATIFEDGETVRHQGTSHLWGQLDISLATKFATLPARLFEIIPETAPPLVWMIGPAFRERRPRLDSLASSIAKMVAALS